MEFDNTFTVPLPPDEAWKVLMDIERIAPCMPGAELTEIVDPETFKGKVSVRLGPVALTFAGQARFEETDDDARTARVKAQGTDAKGRGGANATVRFGIEPEEGGSKVLIHTDLQLSGSVAQYGRGVGMVKDLAQQIIGQFAANLEKNVIAPQAAPAAPAAPAEAKAESPTAAPADAQPAPPPQAAPVQVGSMGLVVLWNAIVRAIKRLFGAAS